jgi:adenylosuccinate synthase
VINADIIVDLQYGDSGKGKIAHILAHKKKYTCVLRYNGGGNAGHTIYHKGKKFVTHQVPVGVFYGIPSIIGPGCVVYPAGLLKEVKELEAAGIRVRGTLFVAKNAHIVTEGHLNEEGGEKKIGTTKQGIGPAYRDKHARVGIRAEAVSELQPFLIDLYDFFYNTKRKRTDVLCEGAQGFGLDIDWGDYPYVTSSHCTTAGALLNGIPYSGVRDVWGVAKAYETYVGSKSFEPKDPIFEKIRTLGEEFGATTGRPRQCNWLSLDALKKAIVMNGVTHVVINKVDILRAAGVWRLYEKGKVRTYATEAAFKTAVLKSLATVGISRSRVHFSERKDAL